MKTFVRALACAALAGALFATTASAATPAPRTAESRKAMEDFDTFVRGGRLDAAKAEAFVKRFGDLATQNPDDLGMPAYQSRSLSIQASLADAGTDKAFFAQKSALVIDKAMKRDPDFLLAWSTRGISRSKAPKALNLRDGAVADFEYVLARAKNAKTEDDRKAIAETYVFYSRLLREQNKEEPAPALQAKAEQLETLLRQQYPEIAQAVLGR